MYVCVFVRLCFIIKDNIIVLYTEIYTKRTIKFQQYQTR